MGPGGKRKLQLHTWLWLASILCTLDRCAVYSLVLLSHTLLFPCHIEACFQGATYISTILFPPFKKKRYRVKFDFWGLEEVLSSQTHLPSWQSSHAGFSPFGCSAQTEIPHTCRPIYTGFPFILISGCVFLNLATAALTQVIAMERYLIRSRNINGHTGH